MSALNTLQKSVTRRTYDVFAKSYKYCEEIRSRVREAAEQYLIDNNIDLGSICLVATGSFGRHEALEASDLDIIPILSSKSLQEAYAPHDTGLRNHLRKQIKLEVSQGQDLTKHTNIHAVSCQDSIGGEADSSTALTQRILVLTEGVSVGGGLQLDEIKSHIIRAYGEKVRTRGRHVLSLCNDVARYYRTLCIEYKAKVDVSAKDWCSRNVKLRHSRKFWYFTTMLSVTTLADEHLCDSDGFEAALLNRLNDPPWLRLVSACPELRAPIEQILEHYAFYLDFMSKAEHRTALSQVDHDSRYNVEMANPFPTVKFNSELLHISMTRLIDQLPVHLRHRIYDWFLL